MNILLKLSASKVSMEYMDTTPFIQGSDSRNKINVYRLESATPALTDLAIAYQVQSGRTTLPISNEGGTTTETIDGETYIKWVFNVPATATAVAGNIVACLVVKTSTAQYKLNILNTVLDSSDFDAFQSGLTGAAATYATAMESLSSSNTQQDQRIFALENDSSSESTKIGLLNTEVFGTSTGENTNEGLKYIVRTNHEGRIDALEDLDISTRLTALESDDVGYFELSSDSGTISTDNLAKVNKHDCIIQKANKIYLKNRTYTESSVDYVEFSHLEINANQSGNVGVNELIITINKSTRAYTTTTISKNIVSVSNIVNDLTSTDTNKPLSAAQGKALKDQLDTLETYIYQGSENGVIDRLKEVLDFLAGESESTTLLDLLNSKADKSTTYTKTETDTLLDAKANASETYTKFEVNDIASTKADKSTTYTKTEVNTLLGQKANSSSVYTKSEVYNKTEVDDIVNTLTVDGYEMPYARMLSIFNDAYSSDPVVLALNNLNGEVV